MINKLDIEKQVRLLGALSRAEVKDQMIQCDAFVLSSLFETFGVVIIEALACGKPVVATKTARAGIEGGILVADNPKEFAEKVSELLKDKNLRDKTGKEARRLIEKKYTWENTVKNYEKIYSRLR